jgi:hypothetical protein
VDHALHQRAAIIVLDEAHPAVTRQRCLTREALQSKGTGMGSYHRQAFKGKDMERCQRPSMIFQVKPCSANIQDQLPPGALGTCSDSPRDLEDTDSCQRPSIRLSTMLTAVAMSLPAAAAASKRGGASALCKSRSAAYNKFYDIRPCMVTCILR